MGHRIFRCLAQPEVSLAVTFFRPQVFSNLLTSQNRLLQVFQCFLRVLLLSLGFYGSIGFFRVPKGSLGLHKVPKGSFWFVRAELISIQSCALLNSCYLLFRLGMIYYINTSNSNTQHKSAKLNVQLHCAMQVSTFLFCVVKSSS